MTVDIWVTIAFVENYVRHPRLSQMTLDKYVGQKI